MLAAFQKVALCFEYLNINKILLIVNFILSLCKNYFSREKSHEILITALREFSIFANLISKKNFIQI